jgi:hypothetical protein
MEYFRKWDDELKLNIFYKFEVIDAIIPLLVTEA